MSTAIRLAAVVAITAVGILAHIAKRDRADYDVRVVHEPMGLADVARDQHRRLQAQARWLAEFSAWLELEDSEAMWLEFRTVNRDAQEGR